MVFGYKQFGEIKRKMELYYVNGNKVERTSQN